MATIYVDSAATGANNGTSWTDAYTSITSVQSTAAGNTVLVDDGHVEDWGNITFSFTNATLASPIDVVCVDKADDSLSSGAIVGEYSASNSDLGIQPNGRVNWHGFTIRAGRDINIGSNGTGGVNYFKNCTFELAHVATAGKMTWGYRNTLNICEGCTFDWNSQALQDGLGYGVTVLKNCTFTNMTGTTSALWNGSNSSTTDNILRAYDCDFSSLPNAIGFSSSRDIVRIERCKLAGSTLASVTEGTIGRYASRYEFINCDDGTITVPPLGVSFVAEYAGSQSYSLSRYRTGGADDGEQANAYSLEMATNANASEKGTCIESVPFVRWVASGSQTITVHVASGATLNDDDFWIEVSSPDEGGTPTAQGTFNTTRIADPKGTPTALTTDSVSTWNGTGVATKQKIDVSITPAVAGPVTVRCYLAKPSTTVYVDPKLGVA